MSASALLRAVLDTNVLVSALLSPRGAPARVLLAVVDSRFTHVTSAYIRDEFVAVVARPHIRQIARFAAAEIAEARAAIESRAEVVAGTHELAGVLEDPKDHPIVACALEGGAD